MLRPYKAVVAQWSPVQAAVVCVVDYHALQGAELSVLLRLAYYKMGAQRFEPKYSVALFFDEAQ